MARDVLNPSAFFTAGPTGPTGPVAYIVETNRIELNLKKTSVAFLEMEPYIMSGDMDQVENCEQTIQYAVERIGEVLHTINPANRSTVLSNALRGAYTSSPNITEWYPDMMSLYMNRAEELDGELDSDQDEPNMEVVHSEYFTIVPHSVSVTASSTSSRPLNHTSSGSGLGSGPANYCTVVKQVKKENVTPANIGEIILCQIPGISSVTALAIMKHYTSFPHFIEELQKNPNCLENMTSESNGKVRKINKTSIQNIKLYLGRGLERAGDEVVGERLNSVGASRRSPTVETVSASV